ncbi:MAG: phosphoglycerate kinase [Verrucomicrobiae bacterium]|nr:phosphoglycerate kinase [Verrucomicrobiae bacterium]
MAKTKTIRDVDVRGKRVFVRVDFNVPLDENGKVSDNTRIVAALSTISYLIDAGAKVILASHLGRPKGAPNPAFSLKPAAEELAAQLGKPVQFAEDCVGPDVEVAVNSLEAGSVLLLENVRFYAGEEGNDPEFAKKLGALADVYVNDAFGTAHRAHASTAGITDYVDTCVCGFLIERELTFLGEKTSNPEKPFTVILGGAKVSDKIKVIDRLLEKADTILIGGAMAYTFALAKGQKVGKSLSEPDKVNVAQAALDKAKEKGVRFLLPIDTVITNNLDFGSRSVGEMEIVQGDIPEGWEGVDIGPKTIELYSQVVAESKTVLWNGPMGVFEIEECSKGTFAIADAVAANQDAISIIGGGDSVKAINNSGNGDKVSFISTGGGASLSFLEGKELPGVAALDTVEA